MEIERWVRLESKVGLSSNNMDAPLRCVFGAVERRLPSHLLDGFILQFKFHRYNLRNSNWSI